MGPLCQHPPPPPGPPQALQQPCGRGAPPSWPTLPQATLPETGRCYATYIASACSSRLFEAARHSSNTTLVCRPSSSSFLARTAGTLAVLAALAAGGVALAQGGALPALVPTVKQYLSSSVLAKSGFFAAFSLIFASEIGDKTFFIAALLAMRCGKWVSFVGSVAALSVMTFISVAIGFAVKRVPAAVESSEQIGQWLGAALLLYFGIRTLKDAWGQSGVGEGDELEEAEQSGEWDGGEGLAQGRATSYSKPGVIPPCELAPCL